MGGRGAGGGGDCRLIPAAVAWCDCLKKHPALALSKDSNIQTFAEAPPSSTHLVEYKSKSKSDISTFRPISSNLVEIFARVELLQ